ncbi:MAG TPA: M23 family metallopeptidase [Bryobacteraceae bacterium]|nr:M23 family metallopeptidase [Bryobacteraceae bacterium]
MQQKPYFVVVLAHSLHGRLRRIHVPHQAIYIVLLFAFFGVVSLAGIVSSYARMTWKVANYNSLRHEVDTLRARYSELQRVNSEKTRELATLQMFASEVSVAYGLNRKIGPTNDAKLAPTFRESLEEYNFLQSANISRIYRTYPKQWQTNIRPSLWPVDGQLLSPFGGRTDPFGDGGGEMHPGVDISANMGTPVHAAADGIVTEAEWSSGYGKLVVVDHGNGMETYYAHLSQWSVVPGQEIRRGEIVGLSGATGRVTAPHLHYEVRIGGAPVNPYPYLATSVTPSSLHKAKELPF